MTNGSRREWAVLSEDGCVYSVGIWRDGEYHPGTFRKAFREWRLLRRDEPKVRIVRKTRRAP
jgi:hypothetical protein